MGVLLNLALLSALVASLYGPIYRELTVLGVLRKPSHAARLAEKSFHRIEDTVHCEDLHYYEPAGKIFTACEDSIEPRFKWFPPLGNMEGTAEHTGSIHIIDPQTMKSTRLAFENFEGPFVTHGIDITQDPNRPSAVYIFAVNHLPNPEYNQASANTDDVPMARSQIEVFHHVLGAVTVKHVRSVRHSLIFTPNDIYAESPSSFYVTNDHFYRHGLKRAVEDFAAIAKWTNVVHVQLDPQDPTKPEAGVDATVALTGIKNNNGLGHGRFGEEMLVCSAIGGVMYRAQTSPENRTVSILDEVRVDSTIDNPSYYADPYRTPSDDASGYILAGLLEATNILKSHADPKGKDGAMVWHTKPKAMENGTAPTEWETRLIFEDDGSNIRTGSTALLVPIGPRSQDGKKKAWLFVTGFISENVIAVEVEL